MSHPEWEAPTTRTGPSGSWEGRRYSLECSCRIDGSSWSAKPGTCGVRPNVPVQRTTLSAWISRPAAVTVKPSSRRANREPVLGGIRLQVVRELVLGRERPPRHGEGHTGQPVRLCRGEKSQVVP